MDSRLWGPHMWKCIYDNTQYGTYQIMLPDMNIYIVDNIYISYILSNRYEYYNSKNVEKLNKLITIFTVI